jgi:hypothetical protein
VEVYGYCEPYGIDNWTYQVSVERSYHYIKVLSGPPPPPPPNATAVEINIYSLPASLMDQEPAIVSGSDLHASVTARYTLNGQPQSTTQNTIFSITADVGSQLSLNVGQPPSGWTFACEWDDYGTGQQNSCVFSGSVTSATREIAVFFNPATTSSNTPPQVSITPSVNCRTVTIDGTTTATTPGATITRVRIDWGDYQSEDDGFPTIHASHTYASDGPYTITATVYDSNGLSGISQVSVSLSCTPPPPPPPSAGKRWALVVGIDEYDSKDKDCKTILHNSLNTCGSVTSAKLLYEEFLKLGIDSLLLTDSRGTSSDDISWDGLKQAFSDLKGRTNSNDEIIIYFDGHGDYNAASGEVSLWLHLNGGPEIVSASIFTEEFRSVFNDRKTILIMAWSWSGGFIYINGNPSNLANPSNEDWLLMSGCEGWQNDLNRDCYQDYFGLWPFGEWEDVFTHSLIQAINDLYAKNPACLSAESAFDLAREYTMNFGRWWSGETNVPQVFPESSVNDFYLTDCAQSSIASNSGTDSGISRLFMVARPLVILVASKWTD